MYKSGHVCYDCEYPCYTCLRPNYCYKCLHDTEHVTRSPPYCGCHSGYYAYKELCLPCEPPCLTCSSAKVCKTLDCKNHETGLWKDGLVCSKCIYPCLTCARPNYCYICLHDP